MNIHDNYEKKLELISMFNGVCLNIEERLKLEIALNQLHNRIKSEELLFWGKISGVENDYFFALAINYKGFYEFPQKLFYYATNLDYTFEKLPETFDYHDKDFLMSYNISSPIIGNPKLILKQYKSEDTGDSQNANNEPLDVPLNNDTNERDPDESVDIIKKVEIIKENYTELQKISYIVRNIDHDTNLVPQGAFKIIPLHELRKNDTFKGLSKEDLIKSDYSKFHHFREIKVNRNIVESEDAIFRYDFLDCIRDDPVASSWSMQLDSTKTICNLRSLLWPGYFFVHKSETNIFCGVYIGNGMKNFDLPFMI